MDVVDKRLIGSGQCNQAFLLTTTEKKKYILKIKRTGRTRESELNNLITEGKLLQYLNQRDSSLRIPRVIHIGNRPASYIYDYVEGQALKKTWGKLSERSRKNICHDLAQFHSALYHITNAKILKRIGVKTLEEDKPIQMVKIQKYLKRNLFSVKAQRKMMHLFQTKSLPKEEMRLSLCHNDCNGSNILLHKNRLSAVIDFGDACVADVHTDFMYYAIDIPDAVEMIMLQFERLTRLKLSRERILVLSILELTDQFRQRITVSNRKLINRLMRELASGVN